FGHYLSGRLYVKDPVVRYHANFSMTRLWSEIFNEVNDDAARQVVNYASDFGIRHGVSSGLYLADTESVVITSFAGPKDKFKGRHEYIADILAAHLNRALVRCSSIVPGAVKEKGQEQPLAVF
ncbi:MAG: autoinducer binding domain-containing protein, partial [Deltaproteobacteria bacterium]|nr:autoinducer binding domain-containing protein [Deltaproteobacteria bacterium]